MAKKQENTEIKISKKKLRKVFIIVIISLGILSFLLYVPNNNEIDEEYIQKHLKEDAEKNFNEIVERNLIELYGYDIISVSFIGDKKIGNGWVSVTMKSLGNREDQLLNGLSMLVSVSNTAGFNVESYNVNILSPTEECNYYVSKASWEDYIKNYQEIEYTGSCY
ncbi:hypothetical protein J4407_00445 [Candidatus Pacearchaeota archaeon]|nr:hypothetical protein [Candidatus Pacearchaeota archaeon]